MKTKNQKNKMVPVSFTATPDLKKRFDEFCKSRNLNKSAVVREAMLEAMSAGKQEKAA